MIFTLFIYRIEDVNEEISEDPVNKNDYYLSQVERDLLDDENDVLELME